MSATFTRFLRRAGLWVLVFQALLGAAHLLWPEYRWGQGRGSYFHLDNSLTLASWMVTMQLALIGLLAALRRGRWNGREGSRGSTWWAWTGLAGAAFVASVAEFTRFHHRFRIFGLPRPDPYEFLVVVALGIAILAGVGWFLRGSFEQQSAARRLATAAVGFWGLRLFFSALRWSGLLPEALEDIDPVIRGVTLLFGCTLLWMALIEPDPAQGGPLPQAATTSGSPQPTAAVRRAILLGVGGTTLVLIFLQVVLFQLLTISGDYLTAQAVIAVALFGISIGGLIGFFAVGGSANSAAAGASLLLPVTILGAFGAAVGLADSPIVASFILMLPFVAGSTTISIALVLNRSHVVYFIDLFGAAMGAFLVAPALARFREEGSLFVLAALAALVALCFLATLRSGWGRRLAAVAAIAMVLFFGWVGSGSLGTDVFNVVRYELLQRYPQGEVLFSASSFVGRYDVVRRKPGNKSLSAYENGRITDTIRNRPPDQYQIDPRIPHTLGYRPDILILGLSGDAITKTARFLGGDVVGAEINPAVVELQTGDLVPYNADSYEGIDYRVIDGRTLVIESSRQFDMITLMNAHAARGRTSGRSPSPEYLHTKEALLDYLDRLTDRGFVNVEEPVSRPRREPPVWKMLATMRQALLDYGSTAPERHLFVFQWRTGSNNYIQVLMKKTPLNADEIRRLKLWLEEVDRLPQTEREQQRQIGPINCVTTLLHAPGEKLDTNYARIARGELDADLAAARLLTPTLDNRPFHFDVDPGRPELKQTYLRTLSMLIPLVPLLLLAYSRYRREVRGGMPYVLVVALTGLGYLLIEVVLIQRYEIVLGSPVATFATVLGTLLVSSALGSLASGRMSSRAVHGAVGLLVLVLLLHLDWIPTWTVEAGFETMAAKLAASVLAIAPLGFLMGIPFPYVLRKGKENIAQPAAAVLFAINASTSALAVPLALNLSTAHGFAAVFLAGMAIYAVVGLSLLALDHRPIAPYANGLGSLLLVVMLAVPWWPGEGSAAVPEREGRFRLWALSYGQSVRRESSVLDTGSSRTRVAFEWMFWVARSKDRTFLIDTGTDDEQEARRQGIREPVSPATRLAQMAIQPEDVTDIVITHGHWDHLGRVRSYPNAKIWIQRAEIEWMRAEVSPERPSRRGLRWEHLEALSDAEREGRLVLLDGDTKIAPGIQLFAGGAHTPGSQFAQIETLDGPVVVAGDAAYVYANVRRHEPIGGSADPQESLSALRRMHRLAASPFFILPGHDPLVMRWFPAVGQGIVEIASVPTGTSL